MPNGVTDAIGEGAQQLVRLDPVLGLMLLLLLLGYVVTWRVLWARIRHLEEQLSKSVEARITDKNAQIAEAKADREFWEKMLDRADERLEKGRKT